MVRITKSIAESRLGDVSKEKRFWCHDGRYLKNLQELESALEHMTDETYHYHVSEIKNDFSTWVRDVVGDDKLSRDLGKSFNQSRAARTVAERIASLKTKI